MILRFTLEYILSRDVIFTREAEGLKGKYYIFETKYIPM